MGDGEWHCDVGVVLTDGMGRGSPASGVYDGTGFLGVFLECRFDSGVWVASTPADARLEGGSISIVDGLGDSGKVCIILLCGRV